MTRRSLTPVTLLLLPFLSQAFVPLRAATRLPLPPSWAPSGDALVVAPAPRAPVRLPLPLAAATTKPDNHASTNNKPSPTPPLLARLKSVLGHFFMVSVMLSSSFSSSLFSSPAPAMAALPPAAGVATVAYRDTAVLPTELKTGR